MVTDAEKTARIVGTAYLLRKNGRFPSPEEIELEVRRRERWLGVIFSKSSGEDVFKIASEELFKDPPEDFKLSAN